MQKERRKVARKLVQDSFSLFLVIPDHHGMGKLYIKDISPLGLGFENDNVGTYEDGQELNIRLFTNPFFYLPIQAKVVRARGKTIGLEFMEPQSMPVKAVRKLLEFFELAESSGEMLKPE